ncbi:MAG: GNAT family N-acetyltransferase [Treponema sp.]|nr:GNAT family N-acetyltransferase [Treponema sp.]
MNKTESAELTTASISDLPEIYELYKAAIAHLDECGMHFWDFNWYPSKDVLTADQQKKELYCVRDGGSGRIAACVVLSTEYDEQYTSAQWKYQSDRPLIVHRLCIHPDFQNKGLGKTVMRAVEEWGKLHSFNVIRLDAFSGNAASLTLYSHLGFRKAGEANWTKGMFWLMEKKL